MPALSEYANVYNSAIELLRAKGYQLWFDKQSELFCAEKDGWDFMAESPVGLLGLVAMKEHLAPGQYQEYWWRDEGPLDFRKLPDHPQEYVSVVRKRKQDLPW